MLDKSQRKKEKFIDNRPGYKWLVLFERRHADEISRKTAQLLNVRRANVSEENLKIWFEDVKKYLLFKDLFHVLSEPRRVSSNLSYLDVLAERSHKISYG